MRNGISYSEGKLQIDVDYLASAMSAEDYKKFIKGIALDSFVIDKVVDYICDEDEDGFWTGGSNRTRESILKRIEKTQLSKSVKYNWSFLRTVEEKLKKLSVNKSMYYKIYHSEFLNERQKTALLNGEESEYLTKIADKQIDEIYKMFENALKSLTTPTESEEE